MSDRKASPRESPAQRYRRYRALVGDAALPLALIDLDAVDRNLATLLAPVRAARKTLRIA